MEANFERLMGAYKRLNMSTAELGAGMTSTFPIDRHRVAELLGFEGVVENALYAHRSLDREIETLAMMSITMLDVYRLAEDFHIWCSSDIDFMELDDAYSGTSFMMPQKKNPNGMAQLELAAILTHQALNLLHDFSKRNTSEVILPGNQAGRYREEVMQTAVGGLMAVKEIIPTVVLHKEPMAAQATASFSQGADLSDALVQECGLSFRESYRVVAALVRAAYDAGNSYETRMKPQDVTVKMLDEAAVAAIGKPVNLSAESLRKAMDPMECVRMKTVFGGCAPETVLESIKRKTATVDKDEAWLNERKAYVTGGAKLLADVCKKIKS
jgi:argininosuccinate lyase